MPRRSHESIDLLLERVWSHLRKYPDGLRVKELAEQLHLERRTVDNYLNRLEERGRVYKEGVLWIADNTPAITLRPIQMEAEEIMMLYLALRLLVKQSDVRNMTAENVLVKISELLHEDAGVSDDVLAIVHQLASRPLVPDYEDTLRKILRAYLYRKYVEITYEPYRGRAFKTVIAPYLLEPSGISYATYVIGHSSIVNDLRTYKVERIQSARILRDAYSIPPTFQGIDILKNAWSIFYGEETVHVVLRFHPDVEKRLRETHWHPSQSEIYSDDEKLGWVRLTFDVANTTDLVPWVRGWGANCEVLEPVLLREQMMGEARALASLYDIVDDDINQSIDDIF